MRPIIRREYLAPIDPRRARRLGMLGPLLGVLAALCAIPAAAEGGSADEPARAPYQVQLSGAPAVACTAVLSEIYCTGSINGVPAGKRLVIQAVAGVLLSNAIPTNGRVLLQTESPFGNYFAVASVSTFPNFTLPFVDGYSTSFQTHQIVYVDGGTPIKIYVNLYGATVAVSNGLPSITVTGYVIDCAASRCEPIVTL